MAELFEWDTKDAEGKAVKLSFTKVLDTPTGVFEDSNKEGGQLAANFYVLKEVLTDKDQWGIVRGMKMKEFNQLLNAWNIDLD